MKRTAVMVVAWVGCVGGFGCGDKSPKEKCEDLVDQICDRLVECISGATGMHASCVQEFNSLQACQNVKSVGSSFDDCMNQLDSRSCQALFPTTTSGMPSVALPNACNGVLSDQPSGRDAAPTLRLSTPLSDLLRGVVDGIGGGERPAGP